MGKKLVVLVLSVMLVLGMMAPAAMAGTASSFVVLPDTMGGLNVRSGPGTNYKVAGWATDGDEIDLIKIGTSWTKIRVIRSGKVGYIKNAFIKDVPSGGSSQPSTPSTSGTASAGRVTGRSINLRSGAGTGYKVIGSATSGTKLKIWSEKGNWYYVTTLSGKKGWISKSYVSKGYTATTTARVNLRASANGKLVKTLSSGASVSVISITGSWSKVKAGQTTGYVYSKYLK
ncbi:SH3 domain-containing protein [Eubacteriales bacterium OttesenSCG-928-N13]|nr:SH3 domain-containing protein [Eubacteriales bacterium OttesenSCG-928-N13]